MTSPFNKSGQVYCLKAILLPINCRKMELFPRGVATDQTAPRRPFPVHSQGISSHSLVALARTLEYFLPLKLWPSRLLLENKSCMSRFDFTYCSSGFVFAFGDFSFHLSENVQSSHLVQILHFSVRACDNSQLQTRVTSKKSPAWSHHLTDMGCYSDFHLK